MVKPIYSRVSLEEAVDKINELVQECNELRSIIEQAGLSSAETNDARSEKPDND